LRSGIPIREIYRQLRGISSDKVLGLGPAKVMSVPDAVGIALERFMTEKQGVQEELLPSHDPTSSEPMAVTQSVVRSNEQIILSGMAEALVGSCPDCSSQLEFSEGCVKCPVCGYSECG
jgi:ribonucleoside-diphosphate reductase alpha chain